MPEKNQPLLGSEIRSLTARTLYERGANQGTLTQVMRRVGFEVGFNAAWNLPNTREEHKQSIAGALLALTADYFPEETRGDDLDSYNNLVSTLTQFLIDLEKNN